MDFTNEPEKNSEESEVLMPKVFDHVPQRSSGRSSGRRSGLNKKQARNIFYLGVVMGIMLSIAVSLIIPDKKDNPTPLSEIPPVETPETAQTIIPVEPEVIPEELIKGENHSNAAEEYAYDIEEVLGWMKGENKSEGKVAFLTFDDGPSQYTEQVLDILKEKEVPGNFFLLGNKVDKTTDENIVWKRYIEEGHGIGFHSYSHDYDLLYAEKSPNMDVVLEEWDKSLAAAREKFGEDFNSRIFRFPGGGMSWKGMDEARVKLEERDIYDIDWTAMSGDTESKANKPQNQEEAYEMIKDNLSRTANPDIAVILSHDSKEDTVKYLGFIIDKLKEDGYKFGILH